jgi:hypothetical protein
MSLSRVRRAGVLLVAFIATAATAGLAFGQAAPTPSGNMGGGAIGLPVSEKTVAKDMLLSLRAAGGKVAVDGQLYASCGLGTISATAKLAADGSFALRGSVTRKPLVGVRNTTTFSVKGTLTAEGGTGTASMKLKIRSRGHKTRSCSSRTVTWTVRRPIDTGAAAAPAPAEGTLYGLTNQSGTRAKRAIVLHAASGGRRIDRAVLGYRTKCVRGRIVVSEDVDISPEFDVAADGSFREVERFTTKFADVVVKTTVVLRGQFDAAGGASGKFAVTERYASRRSGKSVDVCKTGTRTWAARG